MKYLKIILAILAVIGIGLAIRAYYTKTTELQKVDRSTNQFVRRVRQEINALSEKPDNKFCKDSYDIIKYHIDDYASINRLGSTLQDVQGNQQQQQVLSKDLYSAYAVKFVDQAKYVFGHNEWKSSDQSFIKSEVTRLRSIGKANNYLESGVGVDNDFSEFLKYIEKYYKELQFISECKKFSFKDLDLDKHFPVSDAQSIINDSKTHLNELGIVKNSDVVRNGLTNVPKDIFTVHESYLTKKLAEYKGMYMYSFSLKDYEEHLYGLLKKDINELNHSMYAGVEGISPSSSVSKLLSLLEADHSNAKKYWNNRH